MVSAFAAWYNALAGIAASNHTYVLVFLFGDFGRKGEMGRVWE